MEKPVLTPAVPLRSEYPPMVTTFWTPGVSMRISFTRRMTSDVRSNEAPAGSSAFTKKYPSSSPGTNPPGSAVNPKTMTTNITANAPIMVFDFRNEPLTMFM